MATENEKKYLGPDGWKKAQADLDNFREEAERFLREKGVASRQRSSLLDGPTPSIGLLLGTSYDLIKNADSEDDVAMIRRLSTLSRKVLFNGNAMNFSRLKEHGMVAEIERETRAFIAGFVLAKKLASA